MELRTLSYFLAVAREQNMTEAANVLHVTQPTLSRQIADLEDELGKKLFTRTSRSTVLTEDGMHLRQRAEEILALVNQTEDEMKNDTIDLAGCIRIGAGETHAMHILADLFAELHSRYPRLTVELFTGNADTGGAHLADGGAHLVGKAIVTACELAEFIMGDKWKVARKISFSTTNLVEGVDDVTAIRSCQAIVQGQESARGHQGGSRGHGGVSRARGRRVSLRCARRCGARGST